MVLTDGESVTINNIVYTKNYGEDLVTVTGHTYDAAIGIEVNTLRIPDSIGDGGANNYNVGAINDGLFTNLQITNLFLPKYVTSFSEDTFGWSNIHVYVEEAAAGGVTESHAVLNGNMNIVPLSVAVFRGITINNIIYYYSFGATIDMPGVAMIIGHTISDAPTDGMLNLPDMLTESVGDAIFLYYPILRIFGLANVPGLLSVRLPSTTTFIAPDAFNWNSLTTIYTPSGNINMADQVIAIQSYNTSITNILYNTPPVECFINTVDTANICFSAGTHILTDQGAIPIEEIDSTIHTIRNKRIVGITATRTLEKYVVCFEKDSLGEGIPSQKTTMSTRHGIFYNEKFMKAIDCVGKFKNVYKVAYKGEILYNVLMEKHDKIVVNNLSCETLYPKNCKPSYMYRRIPVVSQSKHC